MERWLRRIWRLYPPDFRRRFGAELERDLDLRRAAGRDVGVRLVLDAVWTLTRAWAAVAGRALTPAGAATDLALALRATRRAPGYALTVITILALALGANTAVFSVTHSVLLEALPYGAPERVYRLQPAPLALGSDGWEVDRSISALPQLEAVALYIENGGGNLTADGTTERVSLTQVTDSFFRVLGVEPLLGNGFEGRAERADVAVLSHDLWVRALGARPDVLGRTVELNGEPFEVVGVMPADVEFPVAVDIWLPFPANAGFYGGAFGPVGCALIREGTDLATLTEALEQRVAARYADAPVESPAVRLTPLREVLTGGVRAPLQVLTVIAGLVALLGCLNLAGLVLARTSARLSELAVRRALGAGRARLFTRLMAEVLFLAAAGGAAGLAAASLTTGLLTGMLPPETPGLQDAGLPPPVLVFSGLVALVAGLLIGLLPSAYGAFVDERPRLSRTATGGTVQRLAQSLLVGAQVAVAAVLVTGASLMGRSLAELEAVPLGYDLEHVLTFRVGLDEAYPDAPARRAYLTNALDRLSGVAGVTAVGATTLLPGQDGWTIGFRLVPQGTAQEDAPYATWVAVTPEYFDAMGIRILAGRLFAEPSEARYDRVAVSETLARELFGRIPATGTRADLYPGREPVPTVVDAVIGGVPIKSRQARPTKVVYTRLDQSPYLSFAVRASGDPLLVADGVHEAMRSLDPGVPAFDLTTTAQSAVCEIATERAVALLSRLFGLSALALAAIGLYGLVSHGLAGRRRELGIRLVMGARPVGLVGVAMRRPVLLTLAGLTAGLAASVALVGLIEPLLFEVTPHDPGSYAVVAVVVLAVAAAAAYVPARRVARLDPSDSLRVE